MPSRRAFSLIEIMVVVAIMIALTAMVIWVVIKPGSDDVADPATLALVNNIATQIGGHDRGTVVVDDKHYFLFDLNGDTLLDGRPADDFDETYRKMAEKLDYGGFLVETQFNWQRDLDDRGRILDRYGSPLHVDWQPSKYGPVGVGVWSAGPDGISGNQDDIRSWVENR